MLSATRPDAPSAADPVPAEAAENGSAQTTTEQLPPTGTTETTQPLASPSLTSPEGGQPSSSPRDGEDQSSDPDATQRLEPVGDKLRSNRPTRESKTRS
jgi:hypothetical protein